MKISRQLILCAAALCFAASSADAAPVKMRIALTTAAGGLADQHTQIFKEEVEKRLPDAFNIEIFPGSQLGTGSENVQAIQLGTLEAAGLGSEGAAVDPKLSIFEIPWIFKDIADFNAVTQGQMFDDMEDIFQHHNMELLAVYGSGFREILATKPIKTLDDMKGLRVRIAPSPARLAFFNELGAIPVTVQWSDAYLALERGTVEAVEAFPVYLRSGKMYEAAKYLARLQYVTQPRYLAVSSTFWDRLSEEEQKTLKEAGRASMERGNTLTEEMEQADIDFMKENGVEVVETDLTGYEAVRDKLLKSYREEFGEDWLALIGAV